MLTALSNKIATKKVDSERILCSVFVFFCFDLIPNFVIKANMLTNNNMQDTAVYISHAQSHWIFTTTCKVCSTTTWILQML